MGLELSGKTILKTVESDEKNYHSAYLIRVLSDLLAQNQTSINEIDFIGVNTGAGSFTGIRVGLAVVKIISDRLCIKVVPYTTTEVLARSYQNNNIMFDARRGSVFYSSNGRETELLPYDEAIKILNGGGIFISDNSLKNNEKFSLYKDNLISYETENKNFAEYELKITKEKILNNETIDSLSLKPAYIQTPPIFIKN